jgi:GT2 family glycosyltransferase
MNPRPKNISNFSVVIPTCARPEVLRLCLERLHPLIQNINRCCYEVIVSDDRPSESTRAMIVRLDPLIKYTAGPGRGPAANRNHGASQARGDWLVFLDDDCVPEPGLLNAYQDRILHGESSRVLEGRISALGERTSIDQEAPINEQGGLLWSCNFCIKKELFVQMGGFDEMFTGPAMEDVDMRERLRTRGEPIVFLKNAAVLHPWRSRKGMAFAKINAEAHRYFFEKHGWPKRIMSLWYFERMFRGIIRNVIRDGHLYGYKGSLRYIFLEMHSFLVMSACLHDTKGRTAG